MNPIDRVPIPGSERVAPSDAAVVGTPDPAEHVCVSVVVRPRTSSAPTAADLAAVSPSARRYLSRQEFVAAHGADAADVSAVERFASESDLIVREADFARRTVRLEGSLGALCAAFGATLQLYRRGNDVFRGRSGPLTIPASLAGIVVGVFGLDDRPQAFSQFRRAAQQATGASSYTPLQVAQAYDFPTGVNGSGQTIALIELGGGYVPADVDAYFVQLGLTSPPLSSVSVDGGTNAPSGDPGSADGEVMLDIEVTGAVAPRAAIVVYFAPNTDQGFLDAVTTAIHDAANHPTVVSISWGGPESSWTAQSLQAFDAAFADAGTLGITVCCAAGDNGSSDGLSDGNAHVDFPASSPHVLACGGTSLQASGATIASETVWNDGAGGGATGGGISDTFALPTWQQNAGVPPSVNAGARVGRGVPDVAGDADPATGYAVRVDGADSVFGGTSAVAPLLAGLTALLNQGLGKSVGFLNPTLYANPTALHDITTGSNGAYSAAVGWDACTGLGSPDGAKIASAVRTA